MAATPSAGATRRRRTVLERFVAVKTRLQFTGWLQYLPTVAVALLLLAAAGITALAIGWHPLGVGIPLFLGGVLAAISAVDVVTLKGGIRPAERRPPRRDDLDAFELMRSRRSCRSFQRRLLSDTDRADLLTSVGVHTRSDVLIGKAQVRLEYVQATLTVWPAVGATEFLVAVAPAEYAGRRLSMSDAACSGLSSTRRVRVSPHVGSDRAPTTEASSRISVPGSPPTATTSFACVPSATARDYCRS